MQVIFDVAARLQAALVDHQAGRTAAAAAAYQVILTVQPSEPNALQLLGVLARGRGDGVEALTLVARAAAVSPGLPGTSVNLENAAHAAMLEINDALDGPVDAVDRIAGRLAGVDGLTFPQLPIIARSRGVAELIRGDETAASAIAARVAAIGNASRVAAAGNGEPSGLSVALDSLERRRRDYGFVGTVVIPSYNAADYLPKALDSIAASVRCARANGGGEDFKVHVAVVDDKSPDNGVDVVRDWMRAHPEQSVTLLHNSWNRGAGASRNLGAAAAYGRYLWFLDADDWFYENHLLLTSRILDERPYVGYVRTGIEFDKIDGMISDKWREASEFTYPCNMAVRRQCHDFIGGFPEEAPFGPAGPEDVAYSRSLKMSFVCAKTSVKTVFYTMRPGNVLEKLYNEMMVEGRNPDQSDLPDAKFAAVEVLIRRRLYALEQKKAAFANFETPLTPDRDTRVIYV